MAVSRFILLDTPLLFFTLLVLYCSLRFIAQRYVALTLPLILLASLLCPLPLTCFKVLYSLQGRKRDVENGKREQERTKENKRVQERNRERENPQTDRERERESGCCEPGRRDMEREGGSQWITFLFDLKAILRQSEPATLTSSFSVLFFYPAA